MLKFEIICFLKVNNEDESFKSSAREFHSLMDDGIQDFCEIVEIEVSIAKSVDPDQTAPYSLHVLLLNVPVNSCGHVRTVSSPNHTFFLGMLEQVVNQYFMPILSLVIDNNPS